MDKYGCLIRIIISFFLYMILGTIALIIIAICCAVIISLQSSGNVEIIFEQFTPVNAPNLIATIQHTFLDKLPFGDIIENAAGGGGFSFGAIISFLRGDDFSIANLLLDMVTATVAGTIIYLSNRANTLLSLFFKGTEFDIVLTITSMIWSICGFSISLTIIQIVDIVVEDNTANIIVKAILFLVCLLLHSAFLANRSGKNIFIKTPLLFLLKRMGDDILSSLLIAGVCVHLHGLYNYSHFWSFMIAAAIATVGLAAQSHHARSDKARLGI